ncbi:hypothetical protein ATEIFO6365_0013012700 [Aspergillus terreus]|uniref:Uncharacterized protein n=1 Tax=Aspergillus terreus TaxID=33178 RepID=A0A5M3ZC35_ASPTE|nr:hypothetical protein ATETN484_0014012700 [Aspergillus terreus]GFF20793.1 hypothetical protein ATEIFO6365_0013012700 [Aspergillus terreus]
MRFSLFATVATLAAGVMAGAADEQPETVVVTEYTTFCPKSSTSFVHGTETYSVSTPGHYTMTGGPYTITRPLITSTVTRCTQCSSTPVATPSSSSVVVVPSSSKPVIPVVPTSAPSAPTGVAATGSATTPAAPIFTGGASRAAAGAGAGLATVFGIVAYLL